jgi:AcrR family transcriptional regulator
MRNYEPSRPRGRPPGQTTARADILASARRLFAVRGYAALSLREVARDAGVDPGLIRHYFTDKEQLFAAAMRLPINPRDVAARVFTGDSHDLGRRLAHFFLTTWDAPGAGEVFVGLLGAALTDPASAALLREIVLRFILGPLSALIGGDEPALRAELAGSHLVGIALGRYALKVEPLASAPADVVVDFVGPTLQRYLMPEAA